MRVLAAAFAATSLSLCAYAADGHQGHGHHGAHDMKAMPPAMKAKHDALEAKLNDTAAFGVKADPKRAARTVIVDAMDISFGVKTLDVKLGETVKFTLVNKGQLTHELTIGDAAYQGHARDMMTMMMDMGMDPASPEHAAMHTGGGNTVVALPGETKSIAWTFSKPGTVLFSCNMIGHAEAGMMGKISVK